MYKVMYRVFLLLLLCSACHPASLKDDYHRQYQHLQSQREAKAQETPFLNNDYFLVLLVDAKHLDYSDAKTLLSTVSKHPDGSRERDVGHAWIILCGIKDGKRVCIEGGHSGELGISHPRYLEGLFLHRNDPNPVRYLFTALPDGYFEKGPGRHKPTFAVRVEINQKTFLKIYELMQPERYPFSEYSLTESQCTTFVVKMASLAGLELDHEVTIPVPPAMELEGQKITLWQDSRYQKLTVSTPDILEKSLLQATHAGKARVACRWYRTEWTKLREAGKDKD